MTPEEMREEKLHKKRLAKFRFRCLVRKVMINRYWLNEMEDQRLGDNPRRNVAIIIRKKGTKGILTLKEKTIFNTPTEFRTLEEKRKIVSIITSLKCFTRFPPKVRSRLARVAEYFYYNPGRVILRENHHASAVYFILDGEVSLSQRKWSLIDNKYIDEHIGIKGPGDMFGEVSLLYNIKRRTTVTAAMDVELLCVFADDFDRILKDTLQLQWSQIQMAMKRFEYFNTWSEDQIRQCCVLSTIKQYNPLQSIYSEDIGRLNYVFFVLSGNCIIYQCLKLKSSTTKYDKKYELLDVEATDSVSRQIIDKIHKAADQMLLESSQHDITKAEEQKQRCFTLNSEAKKDKHIQIISNTTADLNVPKLSITSDKSTIEHHFVEVGTFSCGSVFGLGEQMEHRAIVAKNFVQCLLIPRYWLFQKEQNFGNIWQRTKMYLDSSIPSRAKLFHDFKCTNKWMQYRKQMTEDLHKLHPTSNLTKITDVPIFCRIQEDE